MSAVSANSDAGDVGVNVIVASNRPAVVAAWLARLAEAAGLCATGAVVGDAEALDAACGRSSPDVALLDVAALEWLGDAGVQRLRAYYPRLRVLLVCDSAGPQLAELVLSHRLDGYFVRSDRADLCVKAIFAVRRGELWLPRAALAEALHRPRCDRASVAKAVARSPKIVALTERERQVANCLRKGSTNTEIARELAIKKDTVKKHVRRVLRKFGVQRRTEVALLHAAPRARRAGGRRPLE